jgi:putative ABC transport system substrate-binding protein
VRLNTDVLATSAGWAAVQAFKQATVMTPIVMLSIADPVAAGFVESLARPGGNITGVADLSTDLVVKRLQLLREVVPGVRRVVHVTGPVTEGITASAALRSGWVAAAESLGVGLRHVDVKDLRDFPGASAAIERERPGALLLSPHSLVFQLRARFAEFALTHRLPTMSAHTEAALAGALMSYAPDLAANFRRGAVFIDKILRGAKPSDLPVEQPTTFEMVINLKTAKTLGVAIPRSLLLRADRVIDP